MDPDFHLAAVSPLVHFETCSKVQNATTKKLETPKANVLQRRMAEAIEVLTVLKVPAIRIIVTKIRQCGGTTFSVEVIYHLCQQRNTDALILANIAANSQGILERMRTFSENDSFPWHNPLTPQAVNMKWRNGSTATITSAEAMNPGISKPRQAVLFSESAKYPRGGVKDDKKIFASILPSLNDAGLAIAESTPDGASGVHFNTWQGALTLDAFLNEWTKGNTSPGNGWVKIFAAWFEFADNTKEITDAMRRQINETLSSREANGRLKYKWTDEQIAWRRAIMASECNNSEDSFDEFYPEDEISCIEESIRVPTQRGLIPISEVVKGDFTNGREILGTKANGLKPTVVLTTHQGFRVVCTPDHRIAKADGSWIAAADSKGDSIILTAPEFSTTPYSHQWQSFAGVSCSLLMTPEWGRWLGIYMGNGSFYKNQLSIVSNGTDRDLVCMLTKLSRKLFGHIWTLRKTKHAKALELRSYSILYKPIFAALDLVKPCYHGMMRKVHVPECIWRADKEVIREFLRGIFESDGWISDTGRTAQLFAKDPEFLRQVQQLLLGFGIQSSLTHKNTTLKATGKTYSKGNLYVYQSQIDRFIEEIGFLSARKKARATKGYKKQNLTGSGRSNIITQGSDIVVSVERGELAQVYDLEIAGEPAFAAGGIKVHNCFLSSGRPRFNVASIQKLSKNATLHAPEVGSLVPQGDTVAFQNDPTGFGSFQIWERPKVGCSYIVWCDPMTGEDQTESNDPDRHSIGVLRAQYDEAGGACYKEAVVARVRPPFTGTTMLTADYIALLSEFYGGALVVLEINMGLHVLERLKDAGVPLYKRQVVDPFDRETQKFMEGWKLKDRDQRREVIDSLALAFHNEQLDVFCPHIIKECQSFVWSKNGREEARSGCHDDDVLGLAMAHRCIGSATMHKPYIRRRRRPQDYKRAWN